MLFHVSGGEPMLYKHTADLIEYIDNYYNENKELIKFCFKNSLTFSFILSNSYP